MATIGLDRRMFLKVAGLSASVATMAACGATPAPAAPAATAAPAEATTAPVAATAAPAATQAPAAPVSKYAESPFLAELIQAGSLPPVEERLPKEPLVIPVTEEIGQYGGTWHRCAVGVSDAGIINSRLGYENLVRWSPDASWYVPNTAKDFEINDDATEFTFYLREGMKWSDGEPFTADDFVFWYEDILLNPEATPTIPNFFRDPANAEVMTLSKVDDYTFKMVFSSSYGLFMQVLAGADGLQDRICAPKHYLSQFHPTYADADELQSLTEDAGFSNWWELFGNKRNWDNPEHPRIWPWIPKRVPPELPIVCERNPYYAKTDPDGNQLPYIDQLWIDVVENADLLNLKAVAGELDMQFRHIAWTNYPLLIENADQGDYRVMRWALAEGSNCTLFLNLNHIQEAMRDVLQTLDFRIALSHALNRSEMNELAYQGMGVPRQASVIPQSPYFKEEHGSRYADFDPETAGQLLDSMGLTERDGDGFRLRPDGEQLAIVIEYAPVFGPWRDVIQMTSDQWQQVGIRGVAKESDRTLAEQRLQANEHDCYVWTMDYCYVALARPDRFVPSRPTGNGALWWDWWQSGGEQGEEPPDEVRRQYDLDSQIKGASGEESMRLAEEYFENASVNLWSIGTVGVLPHVGVVKNNFRNVPEEAVSDWLLLTPGNTNVEQYFIRQS